MDELKIDQEFYDAFKKLLIALKDYNKDIVIIGGLANALYEYHDHGQDSPLGVLATKDLDILTSKKVTIVNEKIVEGLEAQGFKIDYKPVENKVITKFILPDTNFEIEFLCPMFGSEFTSKGEKQVITEVQEGINAQPLRYLDIALFDPWVIHSSKIPKLSDLDMDIRIPNPGAYLIQKFIIKDKRMMQSPAFAQKDCFYIYELLLKFRDNWGVLRNCIENILVMNNKKGGYHKVKNFKRDFKDYFSSARSPGIIRCYDELRSRNNTSEVEDLVAVFDLFIDELK